MKIPDVLGQQIDEVIERKGYQNKSEFVREALRVKIERDIVYLRRTDEDSEYWDLNEALKEFIEKDNKTTDESGNQ